MSREIDERVVSMKFDNKQFESGVATTMSTLDKLKDKLNFRGAVQGMDEINRTASRVNLATLEKSADSVKVKFDTMAIVAISAIDRVVDRAMSAGEKLVKSLSVDQITDGWNKYAQKTSAVQTIMAATSGEFNNQADQMAEVNGQLEKLMWFTDETSYYFTDMVSNIGKFTANKVKLDTAVTAMQGIAQWAAISGANATEASRAMYNLSQALGTGAVTAVDWRSIENANMATAEFKEMVLEAAAAEGTLIKTTEGFKTAVKGTSVTVGTFRETLSEKWFDNKTLMNVLNRYGMAVEKIKDLTDITGMTASQTLDVIDKYNNKSLDIANLASTTGVSVNQLTNALEELSTEEMQFSIKTFRAAQEAKTLREAIDATKEAVATKWSQTFEIIFGDYLKAKELWTNLSEILYDLFAASGDTRNEILKDWANWNGRTRLLDALRISWENLNSVIQIFKQAIKEVFPPKTGLELSNLTLGLKNFVKALTPSNEALYTLKVLLKAILIPIKAIITILETGVVIAGKLVKIVFNLIDKLLSFPSKKIGKSMEIIFGDKRYKRLSIAIKNISNKISNAIENLKKRVAGFFKSINFPKFESLTNVLKKILDFLGPIGDFLLDKIVVAVENLSNFNLSSKLEKIKNSLSGVIGFLTKVGKGIGSFFTGIFNSIKNRNISDFKDFINFIGEGFKKAIDLNKTSNLKDIVLRITSVIETLTKRFKELLKNVDPAKVMIFAFGAALTAATISIINTLKSLRGVFDSVSKIIKQFTLNITPKKMTPFEKVGIAIAILVAALVALSLVPIENVKAATKALSQLLVEFALVATILSLIDKAGVSNSSILSVSGSIIMLAGALFILTKTDFTDIGNKLLVLGGLVAAMIALSISFGKFAPKMEGSAFAIITFSAGILALVYALNKITEMNFDGLENNVGTLIAIIGSVILAVKAITKLSFGKSSGLLMIAIGIVAFILALKAISNVNIDTITEALSKIIPMIAILFAISVATRKARSNISKAGFAFVLISAGIIIMSKALGEIGKLSIGEMAKGTVAIISILGMYSLIVYEMSRIDKDSKSIGKTGASLLVMSASMLLIATAMAMIGKIPLKEAMVGGLTILSMLGMFSLIIRQSGNVKKAGGVIAAIAVTIGLVASAIAVLSINGPEDTMKAALSMVAVISVFSLVLNSLKGLKVGDAAVGVMAIGALLFELVVAMKQLNGFKIESDIDSILKISAIIGGLGLIIGVLSKITNNNVNIGKAFVSILSATASLTIIISVINAMFWALGSIDADGKLSESIERGIAIFEKIKNAVSIIVPTILGMSLFISILSKVAIDLVAAGEVMLVIIGAGITFGAVIAEITGIFALLGELTKDQKTIDFIDRGIIIFGKIGHSIGTFVSELIRPLINMITECSANFNKLEDGYMFVNQLKDLLSSFDGVDESTINSIKSMAGAVAILTGSGFVNSITKIASLGFADPLKNLGDSLAKFAPGFVEFTSRISNSVMNPNKLEIAQKCMESIGGFAKAIPGNGAWVEAFGGKDIGKFGDQLKYFAPAFKTFIEEISMVSVDQSVIDSVIPMLNVMIEMANTLSRSGGEWQKFIGEKDMAAFGESLKNFAIYFKSFAYYMSQVDADWSLIDKCIICSKSLAELSSKLPNSDGVLQYWIGNKDLDTFGENLNAFARSFIGYAKIIQQLPDDAEEKTDRIVSLVNSLKELTVGTDAVGGLWQALFGEKGFTGLADGLTGFAEALKSFYDNLTIVNTSFDDAKIQLYYNGQSLIDYLVRGITSRGQYARECTRIIAFEIINEFNNLAINQEYIYSGEAIIDGIIQGINNKNKDLEYLMKRIADDSLLYSFNKALGINSPSKEFYESGKFIILGLKNGIDAYAKTVFASSKNLGIGVIQVMRSVLRINSPSKVAKDDVGRWIVKGVAEGITNDMSAEEAAAQKARNIMDAFQSEIDKWKVNLDNVDKAFQLWSTSNPNTNNGSMIVEMLKNYSGQLEAQANIVSLYKANYEAVKKMKGTNQTEINSAYNKYLEEQTKYAQLASNYSLTKQDARQDFINSVKVVSDTYNEVIDDMLKLGYTEEEVKKAINDRYGVTDYLENSDKLIGITDVKEIMDDYAVDYTDIIVDESVKIQNTIKRSIGGSRSYGTGSVSTSDLTPENIKSMVKEGVFESLTGDSSSVVRGALGNLNLDWVPDEESITSRFDNAVNGASSFFDNIGNWIVDPIGSKAPSINFTYTQNNEFIPTDTSAEIYRKTKSQFASKLDGAWAEINKYNKK